MKRDQDNAVICCTQQKGLKKNQAPDHSTNIYVPVARCQEYHKKHPEFKCPEFQRYQAGIRVTLH